MIIWSTTPEIDHEQSMRPNAKNEEPRAERSETTREASPAKTGCFRRKTFNQEPRTKNSTEILIPRRQPFPNLITGIHPREKEPDDREEERAQHPPFHAFHPSDNRRRARAQKVSECD